MPEIPERKYVRLTKGGITFTVPEEEISYYKRSGYLAEGEEPSDANMTPAEQRMAQIARGEEPDNQVSSLAIENADLPATAGEIATVVNYGPVGSNVPGPAASAEAHAAAEEAEPKPAKKKKAGG